jgi:hypothetical protein
MSTETSELNQPNDGDSGEPRRRFSFLHADTGVDEVDEDVVDRDAVDTDDDADDDAAVNPNLRLVPSVDLWFYLRIYAGLRVLVLAT